MEAKICSQCSLCKPYSAYYKMAAHKDGLASICKACDKDRNRLYRQTRPKKPGVKDKVSTLIARELLAQAKKRCPGCKTVKDLQGFYKSKASRDGVSSHCIVCANELGRNRPKSERKERYAVNKDEIRDNLLRRKYGITLTEYNALLVAQSGVCAICGLRERNKNLAVDHNHKTGVVRGLLCGKCNPAVGYLQDNPILARRLAEYLEKKDNQDVVSTHS